MSANDTRTALMDAALRTVGEKGYAAASARTIAAEAGHNQALVFYHFGTVSDLIAAACRHSTEQRVSFYRSRFAGVQSFSELLELGRQIHAGEQAEGNVTVLAQLLAGARGNEVVGTAVAAALGLWITEVEATLRRVLIGSPLLPMVDLNGLARAISAGFVGIELLDGVDPDGAAAAIGALQQLAGLTEVLLTELDDLGPVASRVVRRRLRALGLSTPS